MCSDNKELDSLTDLPTVEKFPKGTGGSPTSGF